MEQASSAAEVVVGNANDEVVEQASSAGDSVAAQASSVAEAVAGGVAPKSSKTYDHEVDDDEALRALLDRPPPEVGVLLPAVLSSVHTGSSFRCFMLQQSSRCLAGL